MSITKIATLIYMIHFDTGDQMCLSFKEKDMHPDYIKLTLVK